MWRRCLMCVCYFCVALAKMLENNLKRTNAYFWFTFSEDTVPGLRTPGAWAKQHGSEAGDCRLLLRRQEAERKEGKSPRQDLVPYGIEKMLQLLRSLAPRLGETQKPVTPDTRT